MTKIKPFKLRIDYDEIKIVDKPFQNLEELEDTIATIRRKFK